MDWDLRTTLHHFNLPPEFLSVQKCTNVVHLTRARKRLAYGTIHCAESLLLRLATKASEYIMNGIDILQCLH
jgi:hypothetical protein